MTTTVVKSIGSGGGRDYTSLQAWEDAAPANLVTSDQVWKGECYNDSTFSAVLTVSGSTSDSTRYKWLTAASGQSFADHASKLTNVLKANGSNGVLLSNSTAYSHMITVSENYFKVSRLQMSPSNSAAKNLISNNTGTTIDQCIIEIVKNGDKLQMYSASTIQNTLIIDRFGANTSGVGVISTYVSGLMQNCTVVRPSDKSAAGQAIQRSYWSAFVMRNCAIFGFPAAITGGTTGLSATNNYTDQSSPPTGFTQVAFDTSTGSGFEGITDSARDFRIKSTSALKDAGSSTAAPSVDIVDSTRPQNSLYDVGAWELASAAASMFRSRTTTGSRAGSRSAA